MCTIYIPTTLVCVLFDPTIPSYFLVDFVDAFYTCVIFYDTSRGLALLAPCCTQFQLSHHTTTCTHAIEVL